MARDRRHARGFTLLELLVAISILALIAVISWRGLTSLTATRTRLEPQSAQVRALLAGFGQIEADLAHVPLNASLFALPQQPLHVYVVDGRRALQILRLTEAPDGSGANAVQSVLYQVDSGALERITTPAQRYYSAQGSGPSETVALVPQIDELQVRVWRPGVGWITPATDADMSNVSGIEVRLLRHDGASLRRVFPLG